MFLPLCRSNAASVFERLTDGVSVNTNGVITWPTNWAQANSNAINSVVAASGSAPNGDDVTVTKSAGIYMVPTNRSVLHALDATRPPFNTDNTGATDARAAAQSAITAAAAAGRAVYFPKGIYKITATNSNYGLLIPNNSAIFGDGPGLTTFIMTNANGALVTSSVGTNLGGHDIFIRDLAVDLQGLGTNGIVYEGVTNGVIQNVWVKRPFGYGIWLLRTGDSASGEGAAPNHVTVANCRVSGIIDQGIELYGAINCSVVGCRVSGTGGSGYYAWAGAQDCSFIGNVAEAETGASGFIGYFCGSESGISPSPNPAKTLRIVFDGNVWRGVSKAAILAGEADTRLPAQISFLNGAGSGDGTAAGFDIGKISDVLIQGNTLTNFLGGFQISDLGSGLTWDSAKRVVIRDNKFNGGNTCNVYGNSGGVIEGNDFYRLDSGPLILYGTKGARIANNHFYNLGTNAVTSCITLHAAANGTNCSGNIVIGNKGYDDRSTKYTWVTVVLADGSDTNLISNNSALLAAAGAVAVVDSSTGTGNIFQGNDGISSGHTFRGSVVITNALTVGATITAGTGTELLTTAAGKLKQSAVEQNGATLNQVLAWNGSAWVPQNDQTGGAGSVFRDGASVSSPNFRSGTNVLLIASGTTNIDFALTNIDGSKINSGTLADARLSTNVGLLNTAQTITGGKTFANGTPLSFTGAGANWGWDGTSKIGLTNLTLAADQNTILGINGNLVMSNASTLDLKSGAFLAYRTTPSLGALGISDANGLFSWATTIPGTKIWSGANSFTNLGNVFAGDGSGVTNLNATELRSGTVSSNRLATIIADLQNLTLSQGDVLFYNGTHLQNLASGTSNQVLATQGAGQNPLWKNAGAGDVTQAGANAFAGNNTHAGRETFNGDLVLKQTSGDAIDWSATGAITVTNTHNASFALTTSGTPVAGSFRIVRGYNTAATNIVMTNFTTFREYSTTPASASGISTKTILANSTYGFKIEYDGTAYWLSGAEYDNPTVTSLGQMASAGMVSFDGTSNTPPRTITGTANEIAVANGTGSGGNPIISLPAAITATGKTITGGTYTGPTINSPIVTAQTNSDGTASTFVVLDATKKQVSTGTSANLRSTLSDEVGTGPAMFTRVGVVRSIDLPMGAWFTNGIAAPATPAAWTNTADSFQFVDAVTNTIRLRLALPLNWDAGVVRAQMVMGSTLTNSTTSTNVVYGIKGASIAGGGTEDSLTFGTQITVTNHVHRSPYVTTICTTGDITVGNTPAANKNIVLELTRMTSDATDVNTNTVSLVDLQLFYTESATEGSMPASTN